MLRGVAIAVLLLAAAGAGFFGYRYWTSSAATAMDAGPPARRPEFALKDLDGALQSISKWDGKVLLVNFWATWCEPCTAEMPTLEALWRQYRGRGLVVLAVSVDRGAPRLLLELYVARLGLSFPILLDADLSASRAWRVQGLPATFVVRPGGDAVGLAHGAREWNSAEMRALLERFLPAHAHR